MPVEETGFLVRTKYEVRENGKVKKATYSVEEVDYFMTEFNGKFYMFPVFGTYELNFGLWLQNYLHRNRLKILKLKIFYPHYDY